MFGLLYGDIVVWYTDVDALIEDALEFGYPIIKK